MPLRRISGGRELAIDLGTANTLVFLRGSGIVVFEPSVVAIDERTNAVHAVGEEARRMIGRTPATIRAIRPLRHGVIADFEVTAQMLRYFIRRVGGYELDEAIVRHLDTVERLLVGPETAEAAKIACGSAWELPEHLETQVAGRDRLTGLLRRATITADDARTAIAQPVSAIVDAVMQTLETTPPELAADISTRGIVLAGGGALLRGLDRRLAAETHLAVHIADAPLEAVVTGAGATLEETAFTHPAPRRRSGRRRRRH